MGIHVKHAENVDTEVVFALAGIHEQGCYVVIHRVMLKQSSFGIVLRAIDCNYQDQKSAWLRIDHTTFGGVWQPGCECAKGTPVVPHVMRDMP